MHELALAESIVDAVCARADGRPVRRVTVRIGALTAVVPDAMRARTQVSRLFCCCGISSPVPSFMHAS